MNVIVAGPNGQFPAFASWIVADVMAAAGQQVEVEQVDSLAKLGGFMLRAGDRQMIALVRRPDAAFCAEIAASDVPVLFAAASPAGVFGMLRDANGGNATVALRDVCSEYAGLLSLAALERTCWVQPSAADIYLAGFVTSVSEWLGIMLTPAQINEITERRSIVQRDATWFHTEPERASVRNDLEPAMQERVDTVLAEVEQALKDRKPGTLSIGHILFQNGNPPYDVVDGPIDMTGHPRCLFFGPYLSLPAGAWELRLYLSFSEDVLDLPCRAVVEMHRHGESMPLSAMDFNVAVEGMIELQLYFRNPDPTAVLEFKLFCMKAVFNGDVILHDAVLKPRLDRPTGDMKVLTGSVAQDVNDTI